MKLSWYIARYVLLMISFVLLVVVSIDFLFSYVNEMNAVTAGGYTWKDAIVFCLLHLPVDIILILPIVAFLGTLVALVILSLKSELVVMRASGFSIFALARALLISAGILFLIDSALNLFVAPWSIHAAQAEKSFYQNNKSLQLSNGQTWLRSGNHFLLLGGIYPDGSMQDVTDFNVNANKLVSIRQIQSIQLNHDGTWTLHQVSTTNFHATTVDSQATPLVTEPSLISFDLLPAITMQPQEMSIVTLYQYIHYRKSNHLDTASYELQFWNHIFMPLMLPIMVLLAIPFVLGSHRARIYYKLMAGVALGFSFYIIGQFFGSFTLLVSMPPVLGALLPLGIFTFVLLVLLLGLS